MRSAEQLKRTPAQWAQLKRWQRRGGLKALMKHLATVRREPWYVWVTQGQPELTSEQYEQLRKGKR